MNQRRLLFCLLCFFLASALYADDDIALYASPSTEWEPLLIADARSSQVRKGLPVEDQTRESAAGWYHTTYTSRYTGYALASEVQSKADPLVVHLTQDVNSPIIAKLTPKNKAKKVDQGEWVEVTFKQPIDVYFQKAPVLKKTSHVLAAQKTPQDSIPPLRTFEGTLKIKQGFLGMEPRYRYELVDANAQRIGYVIVDDLVLNAPMSGYINKRVLIQGTVATTNNTLVIKAKTLQLKNAGI